MSTQLGLNCQDDRRNIGIEPCTVQPGQKKGHIIAPYDWSLDVATETFNKEYVNEKIQDGTFKVIGGVFGVVTETPDDTTEESTSGELSVVRKGLPIVTTTVKKGYEFQSSIYGYSNQNVYSILEIFETGIIAAAVSLDGTTITGQAVGMYNVGTYTDNDGTNSASTMIKYQLTDPQQYNEQRVYLTNLDFNPNRDISNIIDVKVVATADVSDNKVYISAVWARNNGVKIEGIAAANLKLMINGVANAIVGAVVYNTTTGLYAITPTSTLLLTDSVQVYLFDSVNDIAVAVIGTKYYAGASNSATPVA